LAKFGPAAFTFASDNTGVPGFYFGRSCSIPLTQLRISSLDRGFLAWLPFAVEIAWAPPVAEAAVLVPSAAQGEIACAPPPAGEDTVSSFAYPHVVAAA
jgi:hypothetical protein